MLGDGSRSKTCLPSHTCNQLNDSGSLLRVLAPPVTSDWPLHLEEVPSYWLHSKKFIPNATTQTTIYSINNNMKMIQSDGFFRPRIRATNVWILFLTTADRNVWSPTLYPERDWTSGSWNACSTWKPWPGTARWILTPLILEAVAM